MTYVRITDSKEYEKTEEELAQNHFFDTQYYILVKKNTTSFNDWLNIAPGAGWQSCTPKLYTERGAKSALGQMWDSSGWEMLPVTVEIGAVVGKKVTVL
jgi:hypothetical protein